MKKPLWSLAPAMFLWCAMTLAQAAGVQLKVGQKLAATGSSVLRLETVSSAGTSTVDVPTPAFQDEIVLDNNAIKTIKARMSPAAGVRSTLVLADANKQEIARFPLTAAQPAPVAATPAAPTPAAGDDGDVSTSRVVPLANRSDCQVAAKRWTAGNASDWQDGKNALLVLFNREATVCYQSSLMPHQGDTVYVGVVAKPDDVIEKSTVLFSQCSRQPVEPAVYISGDLAGFRPQAGEDFAVQIVDVRRCWDKEITLTATVKQKDKEAAQGTRPISFYERLRGTLQIGALYTDLHENDFGLRDSAGQNVIYNKEASNNGPEYLASLVVYGIPNYFTGDGFTKGYHGRDIINEHRWQDRTGLVILAGLKDPGDRFGVGLSFELAYGINVFVARQWYRQEHLVGVAEGDVFAGEAANITTKHDWEADTSFGLSFDIRYLTALFKGQ